MDVPANRYSVSTQSFPEQLAPIEYDAGDIVRKVYEKGHFQFRGKRYPVGKAFYGHPIALRATTQDGIFNVFFCHQQIGQIDLHEQ